MKQTTVPSLFRDQSGVLHNKNTADLNAYRQERTRVLQQQEIHSKVEALTSAVAEIREILKNLTGCIHHGN